MLRTRFCFKRLIMDSASDCAPVDMKQAPDKHFIGSVFQLKPLAPTSLSHLTFPV